MRNMHINSLAAFRESGRDFNAREIAIIFHFIKHPKPVTDRQLAAAMGFSHRSAVQPRVSTLINDGGILAETGKTKCRETGKTVRKVALSDKACALLPFAWHRKERRGRPTNNKRAAQAIAQGSLF